MSLDLQSLMKFLVDKNGTDLFINPGAPPMMKIDGKMRPVGKQAFTASQVKQLIYALLDDDQKTTFETDLGLDLGLSIPDAGRFRLNFYWQKGEPALVARYIISDIPSVQQLGLPDVLEELVMSKRGLVIVAGATGTGKSTTMASMINFRNQNSSGHIICVEDPIEFLHVHKKSLISQREIGIDTHCYQDALVSSMRESPDVILIGETRDMDTMKFAITFAETGHLCLTTLHANNARQALDRVVNMFPEQLHKQVRQDLSQHLKAIISQRLPIGVDGKQIAAVEVMLNTPYIQEIIKNGESEKLTEAMEQDVDDGSQTFDQALYALFIQNKITQEEALNHADSRDNLALKFRFGD
jgi:twitching motility protein PilU